MNTTAININMFKPAPIKSREDLIPLLLEIHAELDRIGAHLAAAFATCEAEVNAA